MTDLTAADLREIERKAHEEGADHGLVRREGRDVIATRECWCVGCSDVPQLLTELRTLASEVYRARSENAETEIHAWEAWEDAYARARRLLGETNETQEKREAP